LTAIPGAYADTVNLVCDTCGTNVAMDATALRDPDVVWPLLVEAGWTGSPFVTGMHHCPDCATSSRPAPDDQAIEPPSGRRPELRVEYLRDVVVVTPDSDIDASTADDVRGSLADALASGRHIVLDMRHVGTIDPTCLAVLVRAHSDAKHRHRVLSLAAPSRFVVTALRTMRLHPVFPMFPDLRAAILWLAPRRTAWTARPAQPQPVAAARDR
jgi:anti-anti-sigma factor